MTEPVIDVRSCVERARLNDESAARDLIAHLRPLVWRIVRNHLPRRESEEDLMQEVFVKLFQRLNSYQERAGIPFEHWASRLAVRTCLDALRAERARPEWRWSDLGEGEREWLDYLLSRREEHPAESSSEAARVVRLLLSHLSAPDRLVLTLLDLEQRSTHEISAMTGWTRAMVKMRAMRARQKLRKLARNLMKGDFEVS